MEASLGSLTGCVAYVVAVESECDDAEVVGSGCDGGVVAVANGDAVAVAVSDWGTSYAGGVAQCGHLVEPYGEVVTDYEAS